MSEFEEIALHHWSRQGPDLHLQQLSDLPGLRGYSIDQAVLRTVSYMAKPAVTLPPGELIYKWMGLDVSSASRKRSCATMSAASVSRIWKIIRGLADKGTVSTNECVDRRDRRA